MLWYFLNKYDISRDDWNNPINILYNNINFVCPLQSGNYVSHVIRNTQTSLTKMNH